MRLPTVQKPTAEKPPKHVQTPAAPVSAAVVAKGDGQPVTTQGTKESQPQPAPAAPAAPVVDYSRPTDITELVLDLQRRLIKCEEYQSRRLTAMEFAIAIEGETHRSLEQWRSDGYVIEACRCTNIRCKGWRMVPVDHHRTAPKTTIADTRNPEVQRSELKDTKPKEPEPLKIAPEQTAAVKASLAKERHEKTFKKMLKAGLITQEDDTTLIPKDGPMTWTHDQHLAFAHAFDMDELMELEGKPRELQRKLIAALREIGYDILSAPEKEKKKK